MYALATMVTAGFFSHTTTWRDMPTSFTPPVAALSRRSAFLNSEKIKDQRISVHGDFTFKELEKQMKALKEEHKAMRKAATERAPRRLRTPLRLTGRGCDHGGGARCRELWRRRCGEAQGHGQGPEAHRQSNPTFAVKDPFEEKCVTNTWRSGRAALQGQLHLQPRGPPA